MEKRLCGKWRGGGERREGELGKRRSQLWQDDVMVSKLECFSSCWLDHLSTCWLDHLSTCWLDHLSTKSSFITTLNVGYCGLEEQTLTLLLRSVRTNCALQCLRAEGNALSGKGTFILSKHYLW